MPEKEGFETIKDLKRERTRFTHPRHFRGGVIQSDELLEMAVSMGASAGLSKPFTGKALLAAVQRPWTWGLEVARAFLLRFSFGRILIDSGDPCQPGGDCLYPQTCPFMPLFLRPVWLCW